MTLARREQLSKVMRNVMQMAWTIIKAEAVSKSDAMKRAWATVKKTIGGLTVETKKTVEVYFNEYKKGQPYQGWEVNNRARFDGDDIDSVLESMKKSKLATQIVHHGVNANSITSVVLNTIEEMAGTIDEEMLEIINDTNLIVEELKDVYEFCGETYANKELIKAMGGKWNAASKKWLIIGKPSQADIEKLDAVDAGIVHLLESEIKYAFING